MKKSILIVSAFALILFGCKSFKYPTKDVNGQALHYIQISTNYGNMVVKLYNETPKHRDNMMALAKIHYYDNTLFFRVIKDFMMQGGSCDTRNALPGISLGNCDSSYTVPAEILPSIYHKKGALCAARDNNPAKASSSTQFYIAQGKVYNENELRAFAVSRNLKLTEAQIKDYTTIGGIPQLDGQYTVYGEVIEGLNVVDSICNSPTLQYLNDRPLHDAKLSIKVLR
ncbi:MAG: peptidylprolyl isomerase [Bacteroidetes bacterium]|nr:peptidylprolyl isomerase [Bacteroidota bacterium]